MPTSDEPYYCSQQIVIPPALPDIMKQFTKAAIRTQPQDVLAWAAEYFRAIAAGETPPVKERLEMPAASQKTDTGLTPGLLKVLHRQLSPKTTLPLEKIEEKWLALALPREQFDELAKIGNFATGDQDEVEWMKFFALAASALGENLILTMKITCEILTGDPEGGPARIPFETFRYLYCYLAEIDGDIPEEQIQKVLTYLQTQSTRHEDYVQPRFFLNEFCPNLSNQ